MQARAVLDVLPSPRIETQARAVLDVLLGPSIEEMHRK
jgi:hypothetical protein